MTKTIDRVALDVALHLLATGNSTEVETRDRILTLFSPAGVVCITKTEAAVCAAAIRVTTTRPHPGWTQQRLAVATHLAEQLEGEA